MKWIVFLLAVVFSCFLSAQEESLVDAYDPFDEEYLNVNHAVQARDLIINNGITTRDGSPFSGIAYEKYISGRIRLIDHYRDGVKHGLSLGWYENGAIHRAFQYQKGIRHGACLSWYPNHQKQIDSRYHQGRLVGNYRTWYENGDLRFELNYQPEDAEEDSEMFEADRDGKETDAD